MIKRIGSGGTAWSGLADQRENRKNIELESLVRRERNMGRQEGIWDDFARQ